MKRILATFCLVGMALSLSACESTKSGDSSYTSGRTAGKSAAAPAEKVFQRAQVK